MPPCRKPRRRQGTQRYGNALLALMSRTRFMSVPTLEAEQEKSKRRLSYTCPTAGVNELPKRKDIERIDFSGSRTINEVASRPSRQQLRPCPT